MRIVAAFSSPAISAPAFLIVPHFPFPVSHFQLPRWKQKTKKMWLQGEKIDDNFTDFTNSIRV